MVVFASKEIALRELAPSSSKRRNRSAGSEGGRLAGGMRLARPRWSEGTCGVAIAA